MGLMDILNGMQNGPRGGSANQSGGQSSGMSPITMAMLALLAYKAVKSIGGSQPQAAPSGNAPAPQTQQGGGNDLGSILGGLLPGGLGGALGGGNALPGGLGGALGGGLGGLLGGLLGGGGAAGAGNAGGALSNGLNDLLRQFEQNGHGDATKSWVGDGTNQPVSPDVIRKTLGDDTLSSLAQQAGLSEVDLVNGLAQHLPEFVNRLTPNGRMPTHDEMSHMMRD